MILFAAPNTLQGGHSFMDELETSSLKSNKCSLRLSFSHSKSMNDSDREVEPQSEILLKFADGECCFATFDDSESGSSNI